MLRLLAIHAIVALGISGCGKNDSKPATHDPAGPGAGEAPVDGVGGAAKPPGDTKASRDTVTLAEADFQTPESVLHDTVDDVYFVSNINGSPLAKDNNGFIARVSPDGGTTLRNWIAGGANHVTLNAPKGMAVLGDTLYVADIDVVRMFHRTTAESLGEIAIEGASFLNDLAAGPDAVYVSDTGMRAGGSGLEPAGTDAIYSITADGTVTKLIAGDELGRPNGLYHDGKRLWVVTFGSGELYAVSAGGKRENIIQLPGGQLDGICAATDGSLVISSWEASAIYRGTPSGTFQEVVTDVKAPADIACDNQRHRVVIPLFNDNELRIEPLPQLEETAPDDPKPTRKQTKCEDLEEQVNRAIASLDRACKSDADCDLTGFGCPFGCSVPIRKGVTTKLVEGKAARYYDMCGHCKYNCEQVDVSCVKNQCTSVDAPKSKTIDLIGP